jgi:transmembrane sensor
MKLKIPRHIDQEIFIQATQWQAKLWSDDASTDDLEHFEQWRQQHPFHEQAWQILNQFNQQFTSIAPRQQQLLQDTSKHGKDWLKGGSALLCLFGLAYLIWQQQIFALWLADYRTGAAEVNHFKLSDGTQLILAANSAVNVEFAHGQRQIRLIKGKVFVQTGHQNPALGPLQVWHQHLSVQPLGTQFTVSAQQQRMNIAVYAGAVKIQSEHLAAFVLPQGWQVSFDLHQNNLQKSASDDLQLAWIRHKLVAEQMPLCTFLKQIADYRSSYVLCDTTLQQYSISGIYSLDHSAEILQQLPQLFPVKISTYGHYFVRATAKS